MRIIYLVLLLAIIPPVNPTQQLSLVTSLNSTIEESSGLLYFHQKFITHNDSGGKANLYEFDNNTGNITRTVNIKNANNTDWEDICMDSTYIYIGDFGNNNGSRRDLKVYKIKKSDYLNTPNDTVNSDIINFSYEDQLLFDPNTYFTNFDAEAIIAYQDSLYIFTKNWGNRWTYIYALPKTPGDYSITKIDSINVEGLVTGADYNANTNSIVLSGYTYTKPFLLEIKDVSSNIFSSGNLNNYLLETPIGSSIQIEGVCYAENETLYLSAETNLSGTPSLYKISDASVNINEITKTNECFYPNPSSKFIHISYDDFYQAEIYDLNGQIKLHSFKKKIAITSLHSGVFILVIKNEAGKTISSQKLIVN